MERHQGRCHPARPNLEDTALTAVYILAGGRSSRMGQDKARLMIDGVSLVGRVATAIRDAGLRPVVIRRIREEQPFFDAYGDVVPRLYESAAGATHPLCGVITALRHARSDVLVIPCDVPNVCAGDIIRLQEGGAPSVGFDGQRIHPLFAHVPFHWLGHTERAVGLGQSATQWAKGAAQVHLSEAATFNVNDPDDAATVGATEPSSR